MKESNLKITDMPSWIDIFPWLSLRGWKRAISENDVSPIIDSRHWLIQVDINSDSYFDKVREISEIVTGSQRTSRLGYLFSLIPLSLNFEDLEIEDSLKGRLRNSQLFQFIDVDENNLEDLSFSAELGFKDEIDFVYSLVDASVGEAITDENWINHVPNISTQTSSNGIHNKDFGDSQGEEEASGSPYSELVIQIHKLIDMNFDHPIILNPLLSEELDSGKIQQLLDLLFSSNREHTFENQQKHFVDSPFDQLTYDLENLLSGLNEREQTIFIGRLLTKPSRTLESIGTELNLTRERVRQLEREILNSVVQLHENSDAFQNASISIKEFASELTTLDKTINKWSYLQDEVINASLPTWFVLDQIDDSFESDGRWLAVPGLRQVKERFDAEFDLHSSPYGYIAEEELLEIFAEKVNLSRSELIEWFEGAGYDFFGGLVTNPSIKSMNSKAAALLHYLQKPQQTADLHNALGGATSVRSLKNSLSSDERIVRNGIDSWGLSEWGIDEYTGIQNELIKIVEQKGSVPLDELLIDLPKRFDVAVSSVRTYSDTWPLAIKGGMVVKATERKKSTKTLKDTKNVYHHVGYLAHRIVINSDHVRGSGSPCPPYVAQAQKVEQGTSLSIETPKPFRPIKISWVSVGPTYGSLKTNLEILNARIGSNVVIRFFGGNAEVTLLPSFDNLSVVQQIRLQLGYQDISENVLSLTEISSILGLGGNNSWSNIVRVLSERGEHKLVEMLIAPEINSFKIN